MKMMKERFELNLKNHKIVVVLLLYKRILTHFGFSGMPACLHTCLLAYLYICIPAYMHTCIPAEYTMTTALFQNITPEKLRPPSRKKRSI
jgi:hypothetical protein